MTPHRMVGTHNPTVTFGCDPEFFLQREGKIIGSERAIHETGLCVPSFAPQVYPTATGVFVQDGVQVELHPHPDTCRANIGNEIAIAFKTLKTHLQKMDNISVSFHSVVDIDPAELMALGEKARTLGCAPSQNFYDTTASILVNPATYTKRSAGGHIHLGLPDRVKPYATQLVPLLDTLVGNTSVLIDRDPHAAERRQVYGRAGEYRLPPHGLEYRTLSNFWLRAYPLMSGMMAFCRLAYDMVASDVAYGDFYLSSVLLESVDLPQVAHAINENNLDLAKENWVAVRNFILKYVRERYFGGITTTHMITKFEAFIRGIDAHGIEYWFPEDPMTYWTTTFKEGHGTGFEAFLNRISPV